VSSVLAIAGCGGSVTPSRDAGGRDDASVAEDAAIELDAPELDAGLPRECPPPPACDAPPPPLPPTTSWRHPIATGFTVAMGAPQHRGRDLWLRVGDPQWALAKFTYGRADDDLKDEDVDVYLLRDCAGTWEMLGTATTTEDGESPPVEGVDDTGGRVYFPIPAGRELGVGRHRILFVVRGDHTTTDQFVEVLPPDARFVVSDVDGTQTETETAEFAAIFGGADPAHQPSGPELSWALARRGYRVFYLTARPEWLHQRTHEWLDAHGYAPGIVHTTLSGTGAMGSAAQTFKTDELNALLGRFPGSIDYAIGNTDTDIAAYAAVGLPAERVYSYRYDPGAAGTRVDDYGTLIPLADALPAICPP
jgi:hypothetical protein